VQTFKKMVLEAAALGVMAVAVAFAVNGVRAQGSVRFSRNYFPKADAESRAPLPSDAAPSAQDARSADIAQSRSRAQRSGVAPEVEDAQPSDSTGKHPRHPFREASFDEVVSIYNDPNTERCLNVFIDARSNSVYQQGHIPGAIQADHYRLDECLDLVLAYVQGAEKVIVYCNGGDCEDSLFLCSDLSELDVPNGKLYLYRGGWAEWKSKGMPVAKGPTPRED
jgi:rhodanese-related sulfurtransferase